MATAVIAASFELLLNGQVAHGGIGGGVGEAALEGQEGLVQQGLLDLGQAGALIAFRSNSALVSRGPSRRVCNWAKLLKYPG